MLFALLAASLALHDAAYKDDLAEARQLIAKGADVKAATDLGVTPLWLAAENGSTPMVKLLLDAGANPNAALLDGETPLMAAARGGFSDVAELLLNKDANPNAKATRDQTALMIAASRRHPDVVQILLRYKADPQARSATWSQMMAVPPHGHPPYNRQIPHGHMTALLFAARSGDLRSAQLLLNAGADPNDRDAWGLDALTHAAEANHRDLVLLLAPLAKPATVAAKEPGFTALHAAILHRDATMVEAILKAGANPNLPVTNWTPTRRSSRDYHFTPALIGASPLYLAVRIAEPNLVRTLLQHGADPTFVHNVEYLHDYDQPRKLSVPLTAAANGDGPIVEWKRLDKDARTARVPAVLDALRYR
ncbi:MAG: ankyrin repeat domain-containing protein [Bryobacterales bacterium]|nr:ankyrin repeat domain-containing protein [Bryobacterales bacterium]